MTCQACRGFERHNQDACGKPTAVDVCSVELCAYHGGLLQHGVKVYLDKHPTHEALQRADHGPVIEYLHDDPGTAAVDAALASGLPRPPNLPTINERTNMDQNQKKDGGKVPHHLLPEDALEAVARVLGFGAQKYRPRGWEDGIEYSRVYGAIKRHGKAFFTDRETIDPDSREHHLACLACEALFLLAFELRGGSGSRLDDRPAMTRFDTVAEPGPYSGT